MMDKKNKTIAIGGEPYYSPAMLFTKAKNNFKTELKISYPDKYLTFTYGGYYSLRIILEHLNFNKNEIVLLPSYLCPTILIPFKEYGINYQFYKIKEDLSIHTIDLQNKITKNVKAVFFINYFGFDLQEETKSLLLDTQHKGIVLIQDIVQAFYLPKECILGDYAFTSFRKFFPVEGSFILSKNKIDNSIKTFHKKYFTHKLAGRFYRYAHYTFGIRESFFLNAFNKANNAYYVNKHMGFTRYDEYILNRMDLNKDKQLRKNNYSLLLENFKDIALFKALPDNIYPLAFPILIKERDKIRKALFKVNIYCPIHWILSDEVVEMEFEECLDLSKNILSIPINNQMDNIKKIKSILKN
ncbi:MAG TPA: hypothetical protein PLF32_07585 [Bacteroidales bacterium]|nr:hypothetical protein [Bacteroidales bacterium]HOR82502.1 hypothetical protein [Bacteroidales bacterium]